MTGISNVGSSYGNLVQKATRRNTLEQVAESKQSGTPVDKEQLQTSNQEIRDQARETGADLYALKVQKQSVETYVKTSNQNSSSSESDNNANAIYTPDPAKVNDAVQTVQKRNSVLALYDRMSSAGSEIQDGAKPTPISEYA